MRSLLIIILILPFYSLANDFSIAFKNVSGTTLHCSYKDDGRYKPFVIDSNDYLEFHREFLQTDFRCQMMIPNSVNSKTFINHLFTLQEGYYVFTFENVRCERCPVKKTRWATVVTLPSGFRHYHR